MNEPAREGSNDRKEGEYFYSSASHTRVNKDEGKAGDARGGPRHIMESDFAQAYSYAAMSPAMIPTIPTRIEHWATSLIISGHESSSSLSLSLSSSTESISSISTDLICFSCVGGS